MTSIPSDWAGARSRSKGGGLSVGRPLVGPIYDTLLIGGGLSLITIAYTHWSSVLESSRVVVAADQFIRSQFALILLLCNSAHVAASAIRLYTKPGAYRERRFLTLSLPLVTLVVATVAITFASDWGRHVMAAYVTWTPYHYAAQSYGLAMLYCYRSGCAVEDDDRRLLRVACLAPLGYIFLLGRGAGIEWLVPASWLDQPGVAETRLGLRYVFGALAYVAPLLWAARLIGRGRHVPALSLMVVLSNAVWWTAPVWYGAILTASVFHALQYLAISVVFFVRERHPGPSSRGRLVLSGVWFYAASVALAYVLYSVWPIGYVWLGFDLTESAFLTLAVLSLYHFVVDAYIWRLRRDPNYGVVVQRQAAPA